MTQPAYRISRSWDQNGVIVMKWTNSRGYQQVGPTFATVADARAYINSK